MPVVASLNLQPEPIPRPAPDRDGQSYIHTPAKVFYHDGALARRSSDTQETRITKSAENDTLGGSARFTTFASGPPGACGTTFVGSDFVVALNEAEFNAANHCYENITISYDGKAAEAQIVDMCPSCPQDGLDLTYGLFSYFAPTSLGVLYGEWSYDSGQPKSTPTAEDKPQSTAVSISQSALRLPYANTATTSAAQTAITIPGDDLQVVKQLDMAISDMVGLVAASIAMQGLT